jgi:hypothetical protein
VEVKYLFVAQRTRLTKRRGQSAGPDPWPSLILWTDRSNRRLKFKKRRQQFISVQNETLSVVAMRVSNPDRSPAGINR